MGTLFHDLDLSDFWEDSAYADESYVAGAATEAQVKSVERKLGYKLPASYIALMQSQNGGVPKRKKHPMREATSWADDHIAIAGIQAIAHDTMCSLCGEFGSRFWVKECGYPDIGIYFGDCPSAGNDMLCLDYRACGPAGEPHVVHVDQQADYKITAVADSFEAFIRGLEDEDGTASH